MKAVSKLSTSRSVSDSRDRHGYRRIIGAAMAVGNSVGEEIVIGLPGVEAVEPTARVVGDRAVRVQGHLSARAGGIDGGDRRKPVVDIRIRVAGKDAEGDGRVFIRRAPPSSLAVGVSLSP